MPLRGTSWLTVKLVQGALLTLPGTVVVAVAALITHPPGLTPVRWAGLAVILLIGSLPFTVLGLVIGQALDGQVANSATLFTVIGLSFAGGLLIPDNQLPHAIRQISAVLPPASSPTRPEPRRPATSRASAAPEYCCCGH